MKSEVRCRWNNGLTITVDWLVLLASKVMARTGSEYHSIGGDFSAAKGELRKLNVTAGMGGKSYLAYQKVPAPNLSDQDRAPSTYRGAHRMLLAII